MFLLVPAYPGCPGSKAVKRSLLLLLLDEDCANLVVSILTNTPIFDHIILDRPKTFIPFNTITPDLHIISVQFIFSASCVVDAFINVVFHFIRT